MASKQPVYRLAILKIGPVDVPAEDTYSVSSAMSLINGFYEQGYDVDKLDKFEHRGAEGESREYYSVMFLLKLRD